MEYAGISEKGLIREINQDAILMRSDVSAGLFAVADGMGGHSHGEKASQLIIKELSVWWENFQPSSYDGEFMRMTASIKQAVEYANREIYINYNKKVICGSTIVLLFIYKNQYCILYAGDSRVYQYRGSLWKLLTIDETWENQIDLSVWQKKDLKNPNYGKLVNAIGVRGNMQCRILTGQLKRKDSFLLCTDGLYKFCSDRYLKLCMKKSRRIMHLEDICQKMLDRVYGNGAGDNISFIVVKVKKDLT
ncbi:serine/threonine phosphatase stp [Lachnospiraceae bacterium]|nr:serine/threonine phosphatase stp [Lachnospiraceae bacterium]